MNNRRFLTWGAIVLLIGCNAFIAFFIFHSDRQEVTVSILDIGQGDSILIEGPTGIQMLVDGGPGRAVLRRLPKEMNFFDRSLDIVVETHPDADHIGGLAAVFDRYRVSYFMEPGIPNDTSATVALAAAVKKEQGLQTITARRGMRIHLGGGAYADVLYPDRDVSKLETNNGSIVLHVVYGDTSFMLTGDLPSTEEDWLVLLDGKSGALKSDVLKAGHHGSKHSTDDAWLAAVEPKIVAISAGKDNSYGHPSPEVLARIKNAGAGVVSTIEEGTIRFVSDGETVVQK
ncbi:MAG: MBL fold metallo-hydrolase [Minisyncoccia bacterium]